MKFKLAFDLYEMQEPDAPKEIMERKQIIIQFDEPEMAHPAMQDDIVRAAVLEAVAFARKVVAERTKPSAAAL